MTEPEPPATQALPGTREELEAALACLHLDSFGWALSCCSSHLAEAEDVLQTSYLKILDGRARFTGRSSLKTWVFGVIRRTAQEERRRTAFRRLFGQRWNQGGFPARPPAMDGRAVAEHAATAAHLATAIARLSARQRDVLHLVFYQALTVEEAASILGISVGSARTHYARGKSRLRELLEEAERP